MTRCRLIALSCMFLLLAGCGQTISIKRVSLRDEFTRLSRTVLADDIPSERTLIYLRQHDDVDLYHDDPFALIKRIDARNIAEPDRDALFALMEISFATAQDYHRRRDLAAQLNLACTLYAFQYLFDPQYGASVSPYHPHSRLACDLYNRSLASYVSYAYAEKKGRYAPGMRLNAFVATVELGARRSNISWGPEEFDRFEPAYDLQVEGLEEHYRTFGIGVPLIAVRKMPRRVADASTGGFVPSINQTCAVTAFLRVRSPRVEQGSNLVYTADVELYDPTKTDEISVGPHTVPLETDFTTPLAYMIANAPEPKPFRAMLNPDIWAKLEGLYMLQPYQPDRIPVVFVHGLMSSPRTWIPMINTLMGDPVLNKRYQFWFFMYPTGNPVLYSASLLRNSLNEARATYDPAHTNAAFDRMVVVAHSMGGLLTKFCSQDSSTRFWNVITTQSLYHAGLAPTEEAFVSNIFFFSATPSIERVVFMATPHRGSMYAETWYARLGSWVTRVGKRLETIGAKAVPLLKASGTGSSEQLNALNLNRVPTGLDSLLPNNPMLQASVNTPLAPRITFHSIIGNKRAADPGGTDGIVAYPSSHLDGAASELVIKSGHSVQDRPLAIAEVRRILYAHLAATNTVPAQSTGK